MATTPNPDLKTIGILGGMSAEATHQYYRLINTGVNQLLGGHNAGEILIHSVNFQIIEHCLRREDWVTAATLLAEKARLLERGGANYIFLATNTMHKVREAITAAISVPFVDIFEVTAKAINTRNLGTLGLLGTYPTMTDPFYHQAYHTLGLDILTPAEKDKEEVSRIIFQELCHHRSLDSSKAFYMDVVQKLAEQGAEGVILGCTEISQLIDQDDFPDLPIFDTTALHCQEAVILCTGNKP